MNKLTRIKKIAKITLVIGLILFSYSINFLFVITALGSLHDFGSFIASGQLANSGEDPYSNESPLVFSVKFSDINLEGDAPNLNPPISVIIFKSITEIDPFLSINIWRVLSILLFIASLFILHRTYPVTGYQAVIRLAWAVSLAGFWHTIQLGQIYSAILLFTVLTWVLLKDGRHILAGICLGILISIKPNFVYWAVLLFVAGNWRSFLSAGITAVCISAIPLFTNGFEIYQQWFSASSIFTPNLLLFPGNNSFQGLTARIGQPNLGIIMSALIAMAIIWYIFKTKPDPSITNRLGIVVSLLISPIAWTGYTLMVLPIFFEEQKWNWDLVWSAFIFSIPVIFSLVLFQTSFLNFVIFGWLYGWGLLILLYGSFFKPGILKDKVAAIIKSIHTN